VLNSKIVVFEICESAPQDQLRETSAVFFLLAREIGKTAYPLFDGEKLNGTGIAIFNKTNNHGTKQLIKDG
jgi:hypothetical protein